MWASIPFALSLLLVATFVSFRVFESRREVRFFDEVRKKLDRKVIDLYRLAVMGQIPKEWRYMLYAQLRALLHRLVILLVETLRAIERPLTRLSHRMRTVSPQQGTKNVSEFLKTISPGKKPDGAPPQSEV